MPDIAANAALGASHYQRLTSVPLDFSQTSVHGIDQAVAFTGEHVMSHLSSEKLAYFVELMGCYLLEVARREFGGAYLFYEATAEPVLVIKTEHAHIAIGMITKVRNRLTSPADDLRFHYAGIGQQLQRGGAAVLV